MVRGHAAARRSITRSIAILIVALVVAPALSSCANDPTPSAEPSSTGAPTTTSPEPLTVTCTRDGGTELTAGQIEAQPDGVHVHVENRSGEPASLNGLATDVEPGPSDVVTATPPGPVDVACWPFSGHGGPEPDTTRLQIVDPNGYYRDSELECESKLSWSQINDFVAGATGTPGDPVDIARDVVKGLEPGDELVGVGYPERRDVSAVAIVREDATIAVASFMQADDGGWLMSGGNGCDETDIRF